MLSSRWAEPEDVTCVLACVLYQRATKQNGQTACGPKSASGYCIGSGLLAEQSCA